ncbi:hypothetical protein [Pseudomonas abietaniphila]|uniref:Uncharacterized protein n=1 Tax=Pseudomonas abietaniphila TaxID=89065 RepID=A0A1G8TBI9_9PSED|nr:hypothetical protein [Pseudomonas abietaniphila]SDJ38843.1 hypothetical protein SAMN05216605_12827 [Pseudomonas abietaniphila]
MDYKKLTPQDLDNTRFARAEAAELRFNAKQAIEKLAAELTDDDGAKLGLSITPSSDGLDSAIESPFGVARGRCLIRLGNKGVYAKYVFERKDRDELDRDRWVEVFHFKIDRDKRITSEVPDDQPFHVERNYRHQYFVLAQSLTAALGRDLN